MPKSPIPEQRLTQWNRDDSTIMLRLKSGFDLNLEFGILSLELGPESRSGDGSLAPQNVPGPNAFEPRYDCSNVCYLRLPQSFIW